MIVRVWKAVIDESRANEYESFALTVSRPMFAQHKGFRDVIFARSGSDVVVITMWDTVEDADRLASSPVYAKTVVKIQRMGLVIESGSAVLYRSIS